MGSPRARPLEKVPPTPASRYERAKICARRMVRTANDHVAMKKKTLAEEFTWFSDSFMSKPLGESHSKKKMVKVAAWMATTPTNIQEAVSKGSRKAVGDMMPVRLATIMAIPVSMKGTLKSTWKRIPIAW